MTSYVSSSPTKSECEPLAVVYKRDCNPVAKQDGDQDLTYKMPDDYVFDYNDERADDIKTNFTDKLNQTLDKLRLLTNFYNSTILHAVLYVSIKLDNNNHNATFK